MAGTLGADQPFRYRGYVYDSDTQLYYLQSSYYDPKICRFIYADVLLSTGQGVLGHNSFAYCLNNPIIRFDPSGSRSIFRKILDFFLAHLEGSGGGSGGHLFGGRYNPKTDEWQDGAHPNKFAPNEELSNRRFSGNQQALIDLAQEYSKGVNTEEALILVAWAEEYEVNNHSITVHKNRSGIWSYTYHIKIHGYHIKIKDWE